MNNLVEALKAYETALDALRKELVTSNSVEGIVLLQVIKKTAKVYN
jgi:hypothetical protein